MNSSTWTKLEKTRNTFRAGLCGATKGHRGTQLVEPPFLIIKRNSVRGWDEDSQGVPPTLLDDNVLKSKLEGIPITGTIRSDKPKKSVGNKIPATRRNQKTRKSRRCKILPS